MGFTSIEEVDQGSSFTPVSEVISGGGFVPIEAVRANEERIRSALPETLSIGGVDTKIPLTPALSAYLVQFGAGISGSYRGAKQLLGLDKTGDVSAEAINEAHLAELARDPEVGGYATAGRLIGSGFDPVAYLMPLGKAKSVVDLAKQGFVAGGVLGAVNPIEEGGSRLVNAAASAVATAAVMPAVGQVAARLAGGKWLPLKTPVDRQIAEAAKISQEAAGASPAEVVAEPKPAARVEPAPPAQASQTPQEIVEQYMQTIAGAKHIGEPAAPQQEIPVKPIAEVAPAPIPATPQEHNAERLVDPTYQQAIRDIAGQAGWAQEGGHLMRARAGHEQPWEQPQGEITGRTTWIPHAEWWPDFRRDPSVRLNKQELADAVERAIAGEKLKPQERRAVTYLLDLEDSYRRTARDAHGFAEDAELPAWQPKLTPEEFQSAQDFAGKRLTGEELVTADLTARAAAFDEAAVERLAIQSEGMSDKTYARKLQEIINVHEQVVPSGAGRVGEGKQPFALAGETEGQRAAREAASRDLERRGEQSAAVAEQRAGADRERGDFALTGSGRAADANAKQADLGGFAPLKEAGAVDVQLASRMAGGAVGATTGALTADENASPAEIASRALLGGAAGWQLAKVGGAAIARRSAAKEAGEAITGIPTKTLPRETPDVTVVGDVAEPLLTKEMSQPLIKKLTDLARDHFKANPNARNPNVLISDDIAAKIVTGEIAPEVAAKYGISKTELATAMRSSVTDFARGMARFSHVFRELRASMTPQERALIDGPVGDPGPEPYVRPLWRKVWDAWRGLLVSQPATTMRNAETQAGVVGLDVLQAPLDNWLQRLVGKVTGAKVTTHPLDGLEEALSIFQRNKKNVDQILEAFPSERDRLFQRYLSDVSATGAIPTESKVWQRIGSAVNMVNILNHTQEFILRRAVFQTSLDQQLRNEGKDLAQIIKANNVGAISEDVIHAAVTKALNKTFGETPAYGTFAHKMVTFVNSNPITLTAMPFPRFLVNAIKFQYEYSPMGILSYLSPTERAAFAAGDTSKMSKAIIGTGLLGAAMLFRNSDYAAEKWYEAKNDKDEVIDLRPFNPFASYLFVADVIKRQKDGTLYKLSGSDIAQGLLSTNMRAGTGLYLLDHALGLMSKSADEKKFSTKAQELTGDFLAGFFTPLNVLRDAYDEITEGQSIARDTRAEPLLGPIKSRIPVVSQTLPEAELPTREGPLVTKHPLLRQATGLSVHGPKNALEKELDRLGFERREILPSTGDHELDVKYAKAMGAVSEKIMVPLVESEKFQDLPDTVKGVVLNQTLSDLREEVRKAVNKTLPMEKRIDMEEKKAGPRLRYMLKDFGVFDRLREATK